MAPDTQQNTVPPERTISESTLTPSSDDNSRSSEDNKARPSKWSMWMLNDSETHEVPGSVLLLSVGNHNEPLGLADVPARTNGSTLTRRQSLQAGAGAKKKTKDGATILDPQPEESNNDPLNWPSWRRDSALLSLGLYCMVGGGMTPILAAGFTDVAKTYDASVSDVALTTGLYMMGMGVGAVFVSPTAILFGKRPVYLVSAVVLIVTAVWCAVSPDYNNLLIARVIQGVAVSPVECLPSATIAEIFFLHERAYRIGIYTLLLLGGKNLVPLVSAAIIENLQWRWVFWIVAMFVGFCWALLFLFVPESFWDRSPTAKVRKPAKGSRFSLFSRKSSKTTGEKSPVSDGAVVDATGTGAADSGVRRPSAFRKDSRDLHVGFAGQSSEQKSESDPAQPPRALQNLNSPFYNDVEKTPQANFNNDGGASAPVLSQVGGGVHLDRYTTGLRRRPALTFVQLLKPYNGRLNDDSWWRVALRPFILFAYPAVLWSSLVYSCSVGWLIVLSESVAEIYRHHDSYGFTALSTGLIYISPFIGGVLGTAVAGKVSDIIVRALSKRNDGLYEPEFRLVMAIPVAITTVIGLMGFGWSAHVQDHWIVPTIFFGVISFGCSLGSTTAITFCVDSYRQYAGEALVTLNFSKNIFHGLVFSLFFPNWLQRKGSKSVFIWLGVIQLIVMFSSIPMYIYGKRARMWTHRKQMMARF